MFPLWNGAELLPVAAINHGLPPLVVSVNNDDNPLTSESLAGFHPFLLIVDYVASNDRTAKSTQQYHSKTIAKYQATM